jgi:hypothetical protein
MKKLTYSLIILIFILFSGCGDDEGTETIVPGKATLLFPVNNTDCNEGTILSDTHSEVVFEWVAPDGADSFTLKVTNTDTGTTQTLNTNLNELPVRISRGSEFSWMVISRNTNNAQATESNIWRFYNAGPPEINHVPYPAELITPAMDARVIEGNITLEWKSSDKDGDITSHEILMDTSNPPTKLVGSSSSNTFQPTVLKNQTYFWKVISIDLAGNRSSSPVFKFHVDPADGSAPAENLIKDSEMNDNGSWNYKQLWTGDDNNVEHGFENGAFKFKAEDGVTHSNAVLWQEVHVEVGKTYNFKARVKSEGTTNSWLEVYFGKQDVASAGDDYTEGGAEIFIKSFGDGENCGINAFDGDMLEVASGGCPLPGDSLLDSNGNVIFSEEDLTSNGTILILFKAGNWDGNFGTGIFLDDVILKEVE